MRSVQIKEFGPAEHLVLCETSNPRPGPGQLLIRLAAASVNRADVLLRSGRYHATQPLPLVLGTEGAGVVAALGEGTEGFSLGEEVVAWGGPGFYAEYAVADQAKVVGVPAGVPLEVAAALPVAWLSARYGLGQLGRVKKGDVVLIHAAASGVGSAAVQIAKRAGAFVIGVVGADEKRPFLIELGADRVLHRGEGDILEDVRQLTDGQGADIVLDLVGGETFAASLRAVASGGRVVAMANVALAPSLVDTRDFYPKNASILGFQFTNLQRLGWDPRPDLAVLLADVAAGRLVVPIDSRFALADAGAAHRRLESNRSRGKIVLLTAS